MISFLGHLFLPRHSNNHRPKLIHHKSLFFLIVLAISFSAFISSIRQTLPSVLGVAKDITIEDLLDITNQKRQEEGLPPVVLSDELSKAAMNKAKDMITRDYWAHNAPDGTTPWIFIQDAGYDYVFAGENLAKDFNYSENVVSAWMASPSHRENLLNARYNEIGFAVVNGKLNDSETTLIVQMLGRRQGPPPGFGQGSKVPSGKARGAKGAQTQQREAGIVQTPFVDSKKTTKNITLLILVLLTVAFFLDLVYMERKKLIRLVGHNTDHILFLVSAILIAALFGRGVIL